MSTTAPSDCVFCDIERIASEVETITVLWHQFYVFEPLDPVVPGHLLVVPKRHIVDATDPNSFEIIGIAAALAGEMASRYEAANVITSIGKAATQSVFHLHWHVVPRVEGDGLPLPWTPQHQKKEAEMALRKHGEGEVIPDADQQKTAAQKAGMTAEDAEALRRENEAADGA